MSAIYWDDETGLFVAGDPKRMNAQQRANWQLVQAMLRASYERGYANGRVAGIDEAVCAQMAEAEASLNLEKAIDSNKDLW